MTAGTNGTLRKILTGIFVSVITSLAIYAVLESIAVRDQVKSMQTSWEVPEGAKGAVAVRERVIGIEGRLKALEDWRGEGQRFTRADGSQLRQVLGDMQRGMDVRRIRRMSTIRRSATVRSSSRQARQQRPRRPGEDSPGRACQSFELTT